MSNEIRLQIDTLLRENNIVFEAFYTGKQTRDKWDCDAWICRFSIVPGKSASFEYFTGLGHRKNDKPVRPCASDVLYSLVMDSSAENESFEYWCSNYGFDTDSRKALDTYLQCQSNGKKIRTILGNSLLSKISELLQDY